MNSNEPLVLEITSKRVSSVLCAYLEIPKVFDKERAGAQQEAIGDRVEVAPKGQVAVTQKRGREDKGKPDHSPKHSIDLGLI